MAGSGVKTVSHFTGIACAQYCFLAFDGLPRVEIASHARRAGLYAPGSVVSLQRACCLQAIDVGQAGQRICYGCVFWRLSSVSRCRPRSVATDSRPFLKSRCGWPQPSRVHDIAWVESSFDCSYRHYTHGRNVIAEPRQVFGADRVVV